MRYVYNVNVKYFDAEMEELRQDEKGDWCDLRVANVCVVPNSKDAIKTAISSRDVTSWGESNIIHYNEGDVIICRLGVAIQLPKDKKANIYPRSSTFATWGLLMTNSVGCIDYAYNGNNDEWLAIFYATRSGSITKYDRVCQFDIADRDILIFHKKDELGLTDRGGYGTTGTN